MPDDVQKIAYPSHCTFLGFDYSQNKIGVAVGQQLTGSANPLKTILAINKKENWSVIDDIIKQWRPCALVIGLPLTLDGESQEMTELSKNFGNQLQERYNLPIHFMDERLTSREASHMLGYDGHTSPRRQNRLGKKVKKHQQQGHDIDKVAAQLILQSWLNEHGSL